MADARTGHLYNFSFTHVFEDQVSVTSTGHFYQDESNPFAAAQRVHEIIARDRERYPSMSDGTLSGLRVSPGKRRGSGDS